MDLCNQSPFDEVLVGCLTSHQHASVSQGHICIGNWTCCHTETEVARKTYCLTQSQYIDTGPASPSTDPITLGALWSTHWLIHFKVGGMTRPGKTLAVPHVAHPGFGWLVGCLTSQQHASVSQGRICSDSLTCCHTEIEVADQTFHLTQSQYTDTGPTSPSADIITPGAWQGSLWSANF